MPSPPLWPWPRFPARTMGLRWGWRFFSPVSGRPQTGGLGGGWLSRGPTLLGVLEKARPSRLGLEGTQLCRPPGLVPMAVGSMGQACSIPRPVFVRLLLLFVPHPLLRSAGIFGCKIPVSFQLNRGERLWPNVSGRTAGAGPLRPGVGAPQPRQPETSSCLGQRQREMEVQRERGREAQRQRPQARETA